MFSTGRDGRVQRAIMGDVLSTARDKQMAAVDENVNKAEPRGDHFGVEVLPSRPADTVIPVP